MIDITGLNKAKVLKALYDHSDARVQTNLIPIYSNNIPLYVCEKSLEYTKVIRYLYGKII